MDFTCKRAECLKQGAIREMFDKAATMENVISMGIGEPDMPTPEPICNAAAEALYRGDTHYTPNAGTLQLRKAICEYASIKDLKYNPNIEIVITNGGMGALFLLMSVILDSGDEVLIQDPQWLNYVSQVDLIGGVAIRVPSYPENNFIMQADEIEKRISKKTRAIIVNSPNNPTGAVISIKTLNEIAGVAKKHDLLVISDEVYNTLLYNNVKARSIAKLEGMRERTLVINSFSKSFAMTGWRIGYAAGPAEIIQKMVLAQENISSCANAPGQAGAAFAIRHPELSAELTRIFARRRKIIIDGLDKIDGISYINPAGAFYVFANISAFGLSSRDFSVKLLEEKGVVCIPGSAFGSCGEGYIRICYTNKEDQLEEALHRMELFCDGLRGK